MDNPFEVDPYPGNPKILFVGLGASTHTHAWIDLLSDSELNLRLFSVPGGGVPPTDWKFPTYICDPTVRLPRNLDPCNRRSFYPLPEDIELFQQQLNKNQAFRFLRVWKKMLAFAGMLLQMPALSYDYLNYGELRARKSKKIGALATDSWLAEVIRGWKPDVIHTLGIFDGQGGMFYFNARKQFNLEKVGTWILELRGGSDIALRQYNPRSASQIFDMFSACDQIITDNQFNIEYAKKLGFGRKIASIAPVPATGGMEIDATTRTLLVPSRRQRVILWPKAYESAWSKALPVLEAIKLAWDHIKPCTIYLTAINDETESWLASLPEEIRKHCHVERRLPRAQLLEKMKQARVMLAPSLVDGLPNVLIEAMANGAFPIVSPLESIVPLVSEYENVLFARNLYPGEISHALIQAMSDDNLVDTAAQNNLELIARIADRTVITAQVRNYYRKLIEKEQQ